MRATTLGDRMIESLVEQIERASPSCRSADRRPRRHRRPQALRRGRPRVPPARARRQARRASGAAPPTTPRAPRELLAEDEDPEVREMLATAARAPGRARGGDPPRDGRARPQRRQERHRRDPRRRGRRRGRPVGRRPLPHAHEVRRAARLQDRAAGGRATAQYTFAIKGDGAYSVFKFEGGTHRVQRVPATESQGRIHTSTATVAVLPEAEEVDVQVDPNDLQIDVYRSSGPGRAVGQHDRLGRAHHAQAERASSSRCRTRSRSCRTARRRCACCARACTSRRWPSSRPSSPPTAARRSAPASARRRSGRTTSASAA